MKLKTLKFLLVGCTTFASSAVFAAACTTNANGEVTNTTGTCTLPASSFQITLYEIGLCASMPTLPLSGAPYSTSNCQVIYSNTTGASVSAGTAQTLTGGTSTIPQPGSYNWGYAVFKNEISVQGSAKFPSTVYSTVSPYPSGTTCVTTTTGSTPLLVSQINASSGPWSCGASNTPPGTTTVKVDNLTPGTTNLLAHTQYTGSSFSQLGNDTVDVYLMNSSNQLATTTTSVTKMIGIQNFLTAPVVINSNSSSLDVGFTKSTGLRVDVSQQGGNTYVLVVPSIPNVKITGH
jgi:hypothetical protein